MLTCPPGWTNTQSSFFGSDSYSNSVGLGDASFALSYLWHKSSGCCGDPDVVITAAVTAPTSNANFLSELLVTPNATLGQGLWAGSWNILFVQKYDPVIVFYGFGSRYTLARDFDGEEVSAGAQYSYRFGVALSVSDRVTLSSTLMGSYITDARINAADLPGTNLEPIYLRLCRHPAAMQRPDMRTLRAARLDQRLGQHSVRHRLDILTVRPEQRLICGPLSPVEKTAIGSEQHRDIAGFMSRRKTLPPILNGPSSSTSHRSRPCGWIRGMRGEAHT